MAQFTKGVSTVPRQLPAFSAYAASFARMAHEILSQASTHARALALSAVATGLLVSGNILPSDSFLTRGQQIQQQLVDAGEAESLAPVSVDWSGSTHASRGRATGQWQIHIAKGEQAWMVAKTPSLWPGAFDSVQHGLMSDMIFLHERAHLHFTSSMPGLFAGPASSDPVLHQLERTYFKKQPQRLLSDPVLIDEMFADSMAAQWLIRKNDPAMDAELRQFFHSWIHFRDNSENVWADHHTADALRIAAGQDWTELRHATPAQSERFAAQAATAGFIRERQRMGDHYNSDPDTVWIGQRVIASLDALGSDCSTPEQRQWFADARAGRPALDALAAPWRFIATDPALFTQRAAGISSNADPMKDQVAIPIAGLVERLALRRAKLHPIPNTSPDFFKTGL